MPFKLSVIMLSVDMLSVVMLNVVALIGRQDCGAKSLTFSPKSELAFIKVGICLTCLMHDVILNRAFQNDYLICHHGWLKLKNPLSLFYLFAHATFHFYNFQTYAAFN